MSEYIDIIGAVANDWRAWAVVGLFALHALWTLRIFLICPLSRGVADIPPSLAAAAEARILVIPRRFLPVMMAGIAFSIIGMGLLLKTDKVAIAMFLTVLGVFLIVTEPVQLRIHQSEQQAMAATARGERAKLDAAARLLLGRRELVLVEGGIVVLLALGMAAL